MKSISGLFVLGLLLMSSFAAVLLVVPATPKASALPPVWVNQAVLPAIGKTACVYDGNFSKMYCLVFVGNGNPSLPNTSNKAFYGDVVNGSISGWTNTTELPQLAYTGAPFGPRSVVTYEAAPSCVVYDDFMYCVSGAGVDTLAFGGGGRNLLISKTTWSASLSNSGIGTWTRQTDYPVVQSQADSGNPLYGVQVPSCVAVIGSIRCTGSWLNGAHSTLVNETAHATITGGTIGAWTIGAVSPALGGTQNMRAGMCALVVQATVCANNGNHGTVGSGVGYKSNSAFSSFSPTGTYPGGNNGGFLAAESCASDSAMIFCVGGTNQTGVSTTLSSLTYFSTDSGASWNHSANYLFNCDVGCAAGIGSTSCVIAAQAAVVVICAGGTFEYSPSGFDHDSNTNAVESLLVPLPPPVGGNLYGCTSNNGGESSLYHISAADGSFSLIGDMGITGCNGLAFNSIGTLYAVGAVRDPFFVDNEGQGGGASSMTCTFAGEVAGDRMVVLISGNQHFTGISDTQSNTYTLLANASIKSATVPAFALIYSAPLPTSGANVITMTFSTIGSEGVSCYEFSNLGSPLLSSTATGTIPGSGSYTAAIGSITPAKGDLVIGDSAGSTCVTDHASLPMITSTIIDGLQGDDLSGIACTSGNQFFTYGGNGNGVISDGSPSTFPTVVSGGNTTTENSANWAYAIATFAPILPKSERLYTVNTGTGTASFVGSINSTDITTQFSDISFQPGTNTLYGASLFPASSPTNARLWTISTLTGAATQIGLITSASGSSGGGLAFNSAGTLYWDNGNESTFDGSPVLFDTLNPTTAHGTVAFGSDTNSTCPFSDIGALVFNSTTLYGEVNCYGSNYLVTIDTSTGAIGVRGLTVTTLDGLATPPGSTPPPPTVGFCVAYKLIAGGSYNAPVLDYIRSGLPQTFTLTSIIRCIPADPGSVWSVNNPLTGISATSTERAISTNSTTGTVMNQTLIFVYWHQYLLSFRWVLCPDATLRDSPAGNPTLFFTAFGSANSGFLLHTPSGIWIDAGSTWHDTTPWLSNLHLFYPSIASALVNSGGGPIISISYCEKSACQASGTQDPTKLLEQGCVSGAIFFQWFQIFGPYFIAFVDFLPSLAIYLRTENPGLGVISYVLIGGVLTAAGIYGGLPASIGTIAPLLLAALIAGSIFQLLRSNKGG